MNVRRNSVDPSDIKGFPPYEVVRPLKVGAFQSLSLRGQFDVFVTDGLKHAAFVAGARGEDIDRVSAVVGYHKVTDCLRIESVVREPSEGAQRFFQADVPDRPSPLGSKFGSICGLVRPRVLPRRPLAIGITMPRVNVVEAGGMLTVRLNLDVHSSLDVRVSGRTTLKLTGTAPTLRLLANGDCDVDGRGFYAEFADLACFNHTRLMLNVEERATVKLHGHGTTSIRGAQATVIPSIRGPGTVQKVDVWPQSCGPWLIPATILN